MRRLQDFFTKGPSINAVTIFSWLFDLSPSPCHHFFQLYGSSISPFFLYLPTSKNGDIIYGWPSVRKQFKTSVLEICVYRYGFTFWSFNQNRKKFQSYESMYPFLRYMSPFRFHSRLLHEMRLLPGRPHPRRRSPDKATPLKVTPMKVTPMKAMSRQATPRKAMIIQKNHAKTRHAHNTPKANDVSN